MDEQVTQPDVDNGEGRSVATQEERDLLARWAD